MPETTRQYWTRTLLKMAEPVLNEFSNRTLNKNLVIETNMPDREKFKGLEILGRTLAGIAPWLEVSAVGQEENLRMKFAKLARQSIDAATDPDSPDYCHFSTGEKYSGIQWLADAAFLALALIHAPRELCKKLDPHVQKNLADAFRLTRNIRAGFNNWVLFSAVVEAGLHTMGEDYDVMRVDYAIRQIEQWYAGDGFYQDGPQFKMDYYNSYVIHPMIVCLVKMFKRNYLEKVNSNGIEITAGDQLEELVMKRFMRYARIQEMSISPDGSFPPFGRSLAYRCGAFHALAQAALWKTLPDEVSPAMARCALTKVICKTLDSPNTFNSQGWLTIGVCGHQPKMGDYYITTSSLYLASLAFLPLGLPETDDFWTMPDAPITWESVFDGADIPVDSSISSDKKFC